ncbi:glycosyltransferase [Candidatus Saccharibacteria bacterium]|nr:glycosyltransferase [Candidatus Saccharibacteria bacterium]
MPAKKPEVSVIIPAYNESTYIDRLLDALVQQKGVDFDVIVSDAQSKDGTKEVVESFKDKLDVAFVEALPKGPAFGRNQGAKQARGDWLLFFDADVNLDDPLFIRTLVDGASEHDWSTSSGQLKVGGDSFLGKIGHNQGYLNLMSHTKHPIMQGYCILTKRKVFEELKGFDESIQYGEDNDYATRSAPYGFGFVKDVYYIVDPRRYEQEGWKLLLKNTRHEIYRLTHGFSFEKNKAKYEFGHHENRKD